MSVIRRDFLPGDLGPEAVARGVGGVVAVQARQTLAETDWLLDLAARHDLVCGVAGWFPLTAPDIRDILARYAGQSRLKAVRHVLQGEADERYMLRDDFNRGISALAEFELAYDILIFEHQLPQTLEFVDRHPRQLFVLDHIAKPRIRNGSFGEWAKHMQALAERPQVYCKISGMVTEADYQTWRARELRPYFDVVLESFGADRVLFGSDWPVCLVAASYRRWFDVVVQQIERFSEVERAAILGGTATQAYRLDKQAAIQC